MKHTIGFWENGRDMCHTITISVSVLLILVENNFICVVSGHLTGKFSVNMFCDLPVTLFDDIYSLYQ